TTSSRRRRPTMPANERTNAARTCFSEIRYWRTGWYSVFLSSAMVLRGDGGYEARVVGRQHVLAAQLAREGRQPDAADAHEHEHVGQRQGEALALDGRGQEPEPVERLGRQRPHGH